MKVLISGAFDASAWKNPLFPAVASAAEALGHEVFRLDAAFLDRPTRWQKLAERVMTVPVRLLGGDKRLVKPCLPWTAIAQQERALLQAVERFQPDVLLVMSYVPYRARVLQRCRDMGAGRLVGWFLEGPTHEFRAEDEARLYDRYFCIHRHLADDAAKRITWLPTLCVDSAHFFPMPDVVRQNKVVFVGARTPRRVQFLSALVQLHLDMALEIWGPGGWDQDPVLRRAFKGEFVWGDALNRLYNEAAIVVNLSSWDPLLGGLTQRVMDVPATGALLLTDACDDLSAFFRAEEELVTFTSPTELAHKCRHYLAHQDEREVIARAGLMRALKAPTSLDIARQLLS